jgi:hypothetical protein
MITIPYTWRMSSYLQSPEFKRASTNAADSSLKLIFKWIAIGIAGLFNFVRSMLRMVIGK